MNANFKNELEWLAFRYAAGDISAAEAEPFERRLADDQEAREALAEAVELGELLAHVPAADWQAPVERAPRRERTGLHYALWALAGAAACLAMVFLANKLGQEGSRAAPSGTPELAEAWSRSLTEEDSLAATLAPSEEELAAAEVNDTEMTDTDTESAEPEAISSLASVAVPSWMVAAVAKDDLPPGLNDDDSDVRIE